MRDIWRYTHETWGLDQAETYFDRIEACCEAVGDGRARSKTLRGLPDSIRIHCCDHHYLVFLHESRPVIIAILQGRIDFMRRPKDRL